MLTPSSIYLISNRIEYNSSMAGRFSDQPARTRSNPFEPVRTRDDVDKHWANAIVARFRRTFSYPEASISFDNLDVGRIRRYDVTTQTITIEFDVI